MKSPRLIQFDGDSLNTLRISLLAVAPEEGCALLIGNQEKASFLTEDSLLRIRLIWPCCNVWKPGIFNISNPLNEQEQDFEANNSRQNRFAIDPREQLLAQRWARNRDLQVLGSAHSHPKGEGDLSTVDKSWAFTSGLIVIVDQCGDANAWWIENNQHFLPLEVAKGNHE